MSNIKIIGDTVSTPLGKGDIPTGVLRKTQITLAELQSMLSNYGNHVGKIIQIVCNAVDLTEDFSIAAPSVVTTATPAISGGFMVNATEESSTTLINVPSKITVNGEPITQGMWTNVAKPDITNGKWDGNRFIDIYWNGTTTVKVRQRLVGTAVQGFTITESSTALTGKAYLLASDVKSVYQKPINIVGLLNISDSSTLTKAVSVSSVSSTTITEENYVVYISESSAYVQTNRWSLNTADNTITSVNGHKYQLTDINCKYYVIAE